MRVDKNNNFLKYFVLVVCQNDYKYRN